MAQFINRSASELPTSKIMGKAQQIEQEPNGKLAISTSIPTGLNVRAFIHGN